MSQIRVELLSDVRWAIESGVAKGGMVESLHLSLALLIDEFERLRAADA